MMEQQERGNIPGMIPCDEFGKPYADIGRGLTDEAAQKQFREQNPHLLAADPMDYGAVLDIDDSFVVDGGVDAAVEDDGCTGGGCKI